MSGSPVKPLAILLLITIISLVAFTTSADANITNAPDNTTFTIYAGFSNNGSGQLVSLNNSAKSQGNQAGGIITGMALGPFDVRGRAYQQLYVANASNQSLDVYWASNGTLLQSIGMGTFPNRVAVSADGTKVAVTLNATNQVAIIDTQIWSVTNIGVGSSPMGIAFNPLIDLQQLAVCNPGSCSITLINTTTLAINQTLNFGSTRAPWGIVYTSNGTLALVTVRGSAAGVSILNMITRTFVRNATSSSVVNPGYIAITPDDQYVYIASEYLSTNYSVVRMGVVNRTFTRYSAAATKPYDVAVSLDGTQVFCTTNGTDPAGKIASSIVRIFISNGTVSRLRPFGNGTALASSPPAGLFGFGNVNAYVNDTAGVLTVTVGRNGAFNRTESVGYGAIDGTAVNGENFTLANGTLTFPPTVKTMTFNVSITPYLEYDGNRTFRLQLTNPTNGSSLTPGKALADVTIVCKSHTPPPPIAGFGANVTGGDAP